MTAHLQASIGSPKWQLRHRIISTYQHVMKKQRQARRNIIRYWTALPREKRQSVDQIAAFAKTAAQQNEDAFVHGRRDPYQKITAWLLPRTGRS